MNCQECIHRKVCKLFLNPEDAEKCIEYSSEKRHKGCSARKTIGQIIQDKRKEKGWIREQLAKKIDTNKNTLASWEHGKSFPNAIFLVSMAEVFECTIDEICGVG